MCPTWAIDYHHPMIHHRTDRIHSAVAIRFAGAFLALVLCGTALAQSSPELDMTVVDARGTTWDVSNGGTLVDLEDVPDRRL